MTKTHKIPTVRAKTPKILKVKTTQKALSIITRTPKKKKIISMTNTNLINNTCIPMKMTIRIQIKDEAGPKALKIKKPSSKKLFKATKS
jgi:hypothetical protein